MKNLDLSKALTASREAAQEGRKVLLHYFRQLKKVQEKAHAGLVSEADVESEKIITKVLQKHFPEVPVLGEEGAFLTKDEHISRTTWVVDPLDGTTNYVHGFHVFCISIGLQVEGELVAGLIDVPILDKTYEAKKGGGAYVNGEKLSVSKTAALRDSLLATGFFPDNTDALKDQLRIFADLVYEARGIRRAGAAAYDMCMVAEGVFDSFWEPNLKPWDTAAGAVLIREAGGSVWNYSGEDYKLGDTTLLAGNTTVCNLLKERIKKLYPSK